MYNISISLLVLAIFNNVCIFARPTGPPPKGFISQPLLHTIMEQVSEAVTYDNATFFSTPSGLLEAARQVCYDGDSISELADYALEDGIIIPDVESDFASLKNIEMISLDIADCEVVQSGFDYSISATNFTAALQADYSLDLRSWSLPVVSGTFNISFQTNNVLELTVSDSGVTYTGCEVYWDELHYQFRLDLTQLDYSRNQMPDFITDLDEDLFESLMCAPTETSLDKQTGGH